MRIVIENGTHNLDNLGDLAMLQIACKRLNEMWPDAAIHAISYHQDEFHRHIADVEVLRPPFARWRHKVGRLSSGRHSVAWQRVMNFAIANLLQFQLPPLIDRFSKNLDNVDLVLMSGSGILADPFTESALLRLHLLEAAQQIGIPTALMSQGLGPIQGKRLRAKSEAVLRKADLIGLRERLNGPALLKDMEVPKAKFVVTGDDSLATAISAPPDQGSQNILGLNLRIAPYSKITQKNEALLSSLESHIQKFLNIKDAALAPIAIHRRDHQRLFQAMPHLERYAPNKLHSHNLAEALSTVNQCRLVVAGSYHAAVFALALGIPAICLCSSQYYKLKFEGLADLFPEGCVVIDLESEAALDSFETGLHRLWTDGEDLRPVLLNQRTKQVCWSEAAYKQLSKLL